jgi:hypothetical protein
MAMFWMITLETPPARRRPFPRSTPLWPVPMMVLSLLTWIGLRAGLVIGAPVILVNGDLKNIKSALCLRRYVGFDPSYLASRAGAVRSTSSLGGSPLSASEVESLRQDDSVRVGRGQVALQLLSGSRSDSLSSSTAGSLGSIALRFARNRLSRNDRGGGNESRAQRSDRRHA